MKEKRVLLIIDPQYGFITGSLAVNGAIEAMDKVGEFLNKEYKNFDEIAISCDWHPSNHCSFKPNGGEWPVHCVQGTLGAEIYDVIITSILDNCPNKLHILTKGDDPTKEEYSVFKNEYSRKRLEYILQDCTEVVACGIALDYCVADSLTDLREINKDVKITLIKEYSPSIGDPTKTIEKLTSLGIEVI